MAGQCPSLPLLHIPEFMCNTVHVMHLHSPFFKALIKESHGFENMAERQFCLSWQKLSPIVKNLGFA
jgi:hypothetical protein